MDTLGGVSLQSLAEVCVEAYPDFTNLSEDERCSVTSETAVWIMLMQNVILDSGTVYPYPMEGERFEMLSAFLAIKKTKLEGVSWIGGKQEAQRWWKVIGRQLNKQGGAVNSGLPSPLTINKAAATFYVSSKIEPFREGKSNIVIVGDRVDEFELGDFCIFAIKEGVHLGGTITIDQVTLTTYSSLPDGFKWGVGDEMTKEECKTLHRFPNGADPVLTVVAITRV